MGLFDSLENLWFLASSNVLCGEATSLVAAIDLVDSILGLDFTVNAFIRGITWAMVVSRRHNFVEDGDQFEDIIDTPFPIDPPNAYSVHRTVITDVSMNAFLGENELIENQTPRFISLYHDFGAGSFIEFQIPYDGLNTDFIGLNGYAHVDR